MGLDNTQHELFCRAVYHYLSYPCCNFTHHGIRNNYTPVPAIISMFLVIIRIAFSPVALLPSPDITILEVAPKIIPRAVILLNSSVLF